MVGRGARTCLHRCHLLACLRNLALRPPDDYRRLSVVSIEIRLLLTAKERAKANLDYMVALGANDRVGF